MSRTLNRSKPFAEVRGHPEVWYSQDGGDFDADGEEIGAEESEEEAPKPVIPVKPGLRK